MNPEKEISITSFSDFQEAIDTYEDCLKNIKEIFHNEKTNIENINGTSTWTGATQEVIYNKHVMLQKNFSPIEEALQVYINFLKKTLADDQNYLNTTDINISDNDSNLDVNS